ncbi:MAG: formylglycine-generating enzyme family protein [Magnetococcus sp. YQC-9]
MKNILSRSALLALILLSQPLLAETDKSITNGIGMELQWIPAGSFLMGSDPTVDKQAVATEQPVHAVEISQPFYLGKFEVTQAQWQLIMGYNQSAFQGPNLPVETVSWPQIQQFFQRLNEKERTTSYRLPTEAEWEYAARAGSRTIRPWGDGIEEMEKHAWFGYDQGNALRHTHPVGKLAPNAWGLYDMLGNVWEWVADKYDHRYYTQSPSRDPRGGEHGEDRVVRGGSWNNAAEYVRVANRHYYYEKHRNEMVGFRVAKSVEER